MEKVTHELKQLRKLATLLQSAWIHGDWIAETVNEREMESIMRDLGYWNDKINQLGFDGLETTSPTNVKEKEMMKGEMTMNNNPGTTNGTSTTLDLINNHIVIRETVGYNFLNNIAIEDIPEVMEFLKIVFNYSKMKDKTNE